MPTRRFSMPPVSADPEPLTFIVDGVRKSSGEKWEESFTVVDGDIPPGAQSDLSNSMTVMDGEVGWLLPDVVKFIGATLRPNLIEDGAFVHDDEWRWNLLIHDKDRRLDPDEMREVMFWITGEKTGFFTGRRPSSSDGSPTANNGSEAAPSPQDATPTGSTPPV